MAAQMRDVVVIGGGPAGSTAATLLKQRGFDVLLLERERFPRFQIGESLLPYNNDLLDRLGVTPRLEEGEFHPKYGAEFVTSDGKISFTFRFDRNLPAEYHRTFQVRRSEFDLLLLRNAAEQGVEVREETSVASVQLDDPKRAAVQLANGETIDARFVVDASGYGSIVGQKFGRKSEIEALKKVAFFAHYRNVPRDSGRDAGNTIIVVLRDAWFWLIPVTADVMSVGLVVERDHFVKCGLQPEQILDRTICETPWMAERMHDAERVTQVYARKDFSYAMQKMVGPNFALVGDAAGFIDPIFSTGVFLAMKGADVAATAVEQRLRGGSMRLLRKYERSINGALNRYFRFIENFYRREFLEVFMQPQNKFGLLQAIVGVLAGNIFTKSIADMMRLELFFFLIRIQRRNGMIAPRINWERLNAAASV
jgi:geranylgeranyl reductase family protein